MKITWVRSFILPLLASLGQILKIVVLFAGGIYVINGTFTIGELTEYIAYAALLTNPIMGLGWLLTVFQQGFVGISSLQTIMTRKGVDDDRKPLSQKDKDHLFKDGIHVKNLNFTYHNGDRPVIEDITFTIEPGQIIGITGKVGSGKTTLINCINGYLRPEKGHVYFGERDAALLRGDDIRSVVKTVTQEVFLFSDTIENNVTFGSEKSFFRDSFEDVIYKSAFADEMSRLPLQGKTLVGEKGIMLSGGQKQRISLARALYTPCDLLILDDVFSAVDSETERFLIREVINNNPAKSVIVISNRISVLEKTDFTIVLEDGHIAAQGNHKQLMESSGFYRDILNLQQEGYSKNNRDE
jgi:ATP-binding cassette subfamily B protein